LALLYVATLLAETIQLSLDKADQKTYNTNKSE
jgi:hypothetical protein